MGKQPHLITYNYIHIHTMAADLNSCWTELTLTWTHVQVCLSQFHAESCWWSGVLACPLELTFNLATGTGLSRPGCTCRFSTRYFTIKESVFPGFDTRFIKLEFDAKPICRLGFLIASKNKVLRAISRFLAPPQNCWKCENCVVFAISFERCSVFKFNFKHSKAHVLEPQKHQEYARMISAHASGSAWRAENWMTAYLNSQLHTP